MSNRSAYRGYFEFLPFSPEIWHFCKFNFPQYHFQSRTYFSLSNCQMLKLNSNQFCKVDHTKLLKYTL